MSNVVGSVPDMVSRARAVLPASWFPITAPNAATSVTPVLDGLLSGIGMAWSACYDLTLYVVRQARISTATGGFLDMIAVDFFGAAFPRGAGETDSIFRNRIRAGLLPSLGTRASLNAVVATSTGQIPFILEPQRAADCGGYGGSSLPAAGGGGGYGTSSVAYGSKLMPFEYLIRVVNGASWSHRESSATFIDANGAMQIAGRLVARPLFVGAGARGLLLEDRGFNLIKDSLGWSALNLAEAGSVCTWTVADSTTQGVLAGQPVLQLGFDAAGSFTGPALPACSSGGAMTGSVWIMVPSGHQLASLSLLMSERSGGSQVATAAIDLAIVNTWQRATLTLQLYDTTTHDVMLAIIGQSKGAMTGPVLTQCWQIENGVSATSYIPTCQGIGVREADDLVTVAAPIADLSQPAGLYGTINWAAPVGSVAWVSVLK